MKTNHTVLILVGLFLSILMEQFFPVFIYITFVISAVFYLSMLVPCFKKKWYISFGMSVLYILSLASMYLVEIAGKSRLESLNVAVFYSFVIISGRVKRGYFSKAMVQIMLIGIVGGIIRIFLDYNIIFTITTIVQMGIMLKWIDPMLTEWALEQRAKRKAKANAISIKEEKL